MAWRSVVICAAAGDGLYGFVLAAGLIDLPGLADLNGFDAAFAGGFDAAFAGGLDATFAGGFDAAFSGGFAGRVEGLFEVDFLSSFGPVVGTAFFSEISVDDHSRAPANDSTAGTPE